MSRDLQVLDNYIGKSLFNLIETEKENPNPKDEDGFNAEIEVISLTQDVKNCYFSLMRIAVFVELRFPVMLV